MRTAVIVLCAFLAGCASTPTVEEVNATQSKMASDCRTKGYKDGTQDFRTCMNLAQVADVQRVQNNGTAVMGGLTAASIGMSLLALSDERIKTDIIKLENLDNGIGLYRFRYVGGDQRYVGVLAQEVLRIRPDAVVEGSDGLLRVRYDLIGAPFVAWERWEATNRRPLRTSAQ